MLFVLLLAPALALRESAQHNAQGNLSVLLADHQARGGFGTINGQECQTQLKSLFCCSTTNGACKDSRLDCHGRAGMGCSWSFKGRICECDSNHCFDPATNTCQKKDALPVVVGPEGRQKSTSVGVEDFLDVLEVTASSSVAVVTTGLDVATSPFQTIGKKGGMFFAGAFAGSQLNKDINKVEEWLQYVLSSFVLYHDNATKSCNKAPTWKVSYATVDYGHCHFPLAQENGTALWEGPLYSYDGGAGHKFNISLKVKADQVRCLEKLQVTKSRCFGNIISDGGLCKLELAPGSKCPISVTNLEVEIFCEGQCSLQSQVKKLLTWDEADNSIEVGKKVYIYKPDSTRYRTECSGQLHVIEKNIIRCNGEGNFCLRHCMGSVGCWHASNLLTEKYCESRITRGARAAFGWLAGRLPDASAANSRTTLLYRKFNAELNKVKVRADVYVYRTRSLFEAVDEEQDDDDDRRKSSIMRSLNEAFGGIGRSLKIIRTQEEANARQLELIKKYKFNMQPKKTKDGKPQGYELVVCNQGVWNEATQDYDLPPLKKCQKVRAVNLQILATQADYLEIQEISSSQNQDTSLTGGSPGIVLSLAAKVARTMFARFSVNMAGIDPTSGTSKFCKDMWKSGSTPEKSFAVGVRCDSSNIMDDNDPDEVGDGVDARYEFEIVELKPVWNAARKRNQQQIGIRGGYNLQWCRVLTQDDRKTKLKAGALICDLDLPTEEGGLGLVRDGAMPPEAIFKMEQIGSNDVGSPVVLSNSNDASGDCADGNDAEAREQVRDGLADGANVSQRLQVRIVSIANGKVCRIQQVLLEKGLFRDTTKKLMVCDANPDASDTSQLTTLTGYTDGLVPSPYWNLLIVLSLSCMGTALGWTGGKWAALLGGAGMIVSAATVVVGTAAGAAGGFVLSGYLANEHHLDGIMLRYLLNRKLQGVGQYILWCIEFALDFELPRMDIARRVAVRMKKPAVLSLGWLKVAFTEAFLFCWIFHSPRLSQDGEGSVCELPKARRSGNSVRSPRPTLANFGAFLPRPSGPSVQKEAQPKEAQCSQSKSSRSGGSSTSAGNSVVSSPTVSSPASDWFSLGSILARSPSPPRPYPTAQPPASLRKVLGQRGGVVKERDGFEVFFGMDAAKAKAKADKAKKDSRDGFDKFYGIRKADLEAEAQEESPTSLSQKGKCEEERQRFLERQLQSRLGGGEGERNGEVGGVPAGVPTFSLAEPALPKGVETFSMCQR
ncbi:unnamed protein product [Effrenium voratum]|nr:unnamed protein product [Effrenium voratum]